MAFTRIGYGQVEPNQLSAQKTGQIYASLPLDTAVDVLRDRKDLRREFVTLQEKMDRAKEEGREEGIEETLQKLSAALNLPIEQLQALLEETR